MANSKRAVGTKSVVSRVVDRADRDKGTAPTDDALRHPVSTVAERPAPIAGDRFVMAGLDLGKQRDPSVLCITEAVEYYLGLFTVGERPSHIDGQGRYHASEPMLEQRFRTVYTVRHIERMPLETPYFEVAQRVADVLGGLPVERLPHPPSLFIDNTGVGQGVVEIINNAFRARPEVRHIRRWPVTLTYGRQEYNLGTGSVSKHALISRLLRLMGAEIPDLEIPRDLALFMPAMDELRTFQERVNAETANQTYNGAPGTHDDIVISLGLSVLLDPGKLKVRYSERVY